MSKLSRHFYTKLWTTYQQGPDIEGQPSLGDQTSRVCYRHFAPRCKINTLSALSSRQLSPMPINRKYFQPACFAPLTCTPTKTAFVIAKEVNFITFFRNFDGKINNLFSCVHHSYTRCPLEKYQKNTHTFTCNLAVSGSYMILKNSENLSHYFI